MEYSEFQPATSLRPFIECYWAAEGLSATQKIVPDGFSEIVFHYGDLYKFRDHQGKEKIQSRAILAGQITKPIYLTPTGNSGAIGIKFKPTGIWRLLGWSMSKFTDEAFDLQKFPNVDLERFILQLCTIDILQDKIQCVEAILLKLLPSQRTSVIDEIVTVIDSSQGDIVMSSLHTQFEISDRTMERTFKEQVGTSAKRYARIVRFRHIFQLIQKQEWSKAEATYLAGYFDQAHFNKEFKEFSGEDPGTYFARHHEFANFFLNRPVGFLQD
jgi:AraC-like DNA-binding protein